MENNTADIQKSKAKKMVLYSLGTLALGTLTFFGIKIYKNHKNNTDDSDNESADHMDSQAPVRTNPPAKPHASLPAANAGGTFPLRLRSKGDKVKQLQLALIRSYGSSILPKFGADGDFGTELEAALKAKGFTVPLTETEYQKITQAQNPQPAAPLLTFDSAAVAKGLYASIIARDFNASIILLKGIKDTTNYSLVSEKLKGYYINGVRTNLVNAMLSTFNESSQKAKVQDSLKAIGLKYNGYQWSLNGIHGTLSGIEKKIKEGSIVKTTEAVLACESQKGLLVLPANMVVGKLRFIQDGVAFIKPSSGGEVCIHSQFIKQLK